MKAVSCLAVLFAAAAGLEIESMDELRTLVDGDKPVAVKFYAPWCGHCKRLAPVWDKLILETEDVVVASIDCDGGGRSACNQLNIEGYPTIKSWKKGDQLLSPSEYNGHRTLPVLQEFLKSLLPQAKAKPQAAAAARIETFPKTRKDYPGVEAFIASEDYDAVISSAGAEKTSPRIVFFDESGERIGRLGLNKQDTKETIAEKLNSRDITQDTPKPSRAIPTNHPAPGDCVMWRQVMADGTRYPAGDKACATAVQPGSGVGYCECGEGKRIKVWIHKSRHSFACRRVCETGTVAWAESGKWQLGPDLDRESDADVDDEADGQDSSSPPPQQAATPSSPPSDPVVVLNPESFAATRDATKLLVFFHATWCGHCKKFMPVYEEVAKKYAGKGVVFGKYDAPENPSVAKAEGVRSFPWLKFYNDGQSIKFEGTRDTAGLEAFLKEQAGI